MLTSTSSNYYKSITITYHHEFNQTHEPQINSLSALMLLVR